MVIVAGGFRSYILREAIIRHDGRGHEYRIFSAVTPREVMPQLEDVFLLPIIGNY